MGREPEHPTQASDHIAVVEHSGSRPMRVLPVQREGSTMRRMRTTAAALSGALVLGTVALAGPTAQAATAPTPAQLNAAWMVKNLGSDGMLHTALYGATTPTQDVKATLDLGESLREVGGQQAALARIDAGLANAVAGWTADGTKGSTAQALAYVSGHGSTTVGGINLLTATENLVADPGQPHEGWVVDDPATTYLNTWTQIWAVKGLLDANSEKFPAALARLAQQQCSDGSFRDGQSLDTQWGPADPESCDAPAPWSSPDAAALAVVTLAGHRDNSAVATLLDKAGTYLAGAQAADGSFTASGIGPNANTTGLATRALGLLGKTAQARSGAAWLRSHQVVAGCDGTLNTEAGAVAHNAKALSDGVKYGISAAADRGQWITADAQALGALVHAPTTTARRAVTLPSTFVKVGAQPTVTVTGLAQGERACLTGALTRSLTGTGTAWKATLPALKAGQSTVTLTTSAGRTQGSITALGAKKLTLKAKKTVKRTSKVTVTVRGLARGEQVTVKLGKVTKKAVAPASGVVKKTFKAAKKRGKVRLKATGQFKNRTHSLTIRVR